MKSFWIVLVFFAFILSCRNSSPLTQVKVGMEERERTHPMRKEAFESTKILTEQKEDEPKKTSIVEKEPEKKEVAQQPDRELKKPSASQRRKSELMSRLEGERPATKEEIEAEEGLMAEITGLIIEQTMTKIGYDFYEYFFLFWEAPQQVGIDDYNIFINERASPMWGSWIWVVVNDSTIWDRVLKPRSTEIEDAAKEAIEVVKQYLVNYQQYEFESEDMIGTGI